MKTTRHTRAAELLTNDVPPAKGTEQLGNSVQVFLTTYAEWIEEYSGLDDALLERKVNTESQTKFDFRVLKLVKSLNLVNIKWRRRRDSNSRRTFTLAGFQDQCIRPLCHPSAVRWRILL